MSRVGNKPITLPKGVKVNIAGSLQVEGPKGKLAVPIPKGIQIRQNEGRLEISRDDKSRAALHGLTRALAANAVTGVSTGFTRELDIVGIGYRAEAKGNVVSFTLGYSHPIEFVLPGGVEAQVAKQATSIDGKPAVHLTVTGADKELLGQVCANMRSLRPPDPYKNKGVRYTGERLRKKVGKTGASAK